VNDLLWLAINSASGSHSVEAVRRVCEALAHAGSPPAEIIDVQDRPIRRAELEAGGARRLAVYAGDGTVNAVAVGLEGWSGQLLVLPGGTANLLAGELHPGREAEHIAAGVRQLVAARRPCIRGGGLTALVEVLVGPGATWSDVREGLREGGVGEVAGAAVTAIRQSTTGPMVVVAAPPLGRADGYAGIRLEVDQGGMAVEGYGAETVGDYLKQGMALLRRNFRDGPHDDLGSHGQVLCRSLGHERLPLMVDGERRDGPAEQRFSLAPFALDLLVSP